MKKSVFSCVFVGLLACVLFTGCASFPTKSGYENRPSGVNSFNISIEKIDVLREQIADPLIANQISGILETLIISKADENAMNLKLSVVVTQRSFLKNISQRNSIYVSYTLSDEDERIYLKKGYYVETDSTIVSSQEQYKIAKMIALGVKSFN